LVVLKNVKLLSSDKKLYWCENAPENNALCKNEENENIGFLICIHTCFNKLQVPYLCSEETWYTVGIYLENIKQDPI